MLSTEGPGAYLFGENLVVLGWIGVIVIRV